MKELHEIVTAYDEALGAGVQTALATVVNLEGSGYRQPGARMLVTDEGKLTGAISGGCLEGDALRKAQSAMFQNKSVLVRYDTNEDDDSKLGIGLGCNGIISILIEPLTTSDPLNPVGLIKKMLGSRDASVLVTLFAHDLKGDHPGTIILVQNELPSMHNLLPSYHSSIEIEARQVLASRHSILKRHESHDVFLQYVEPSPVVIIFGAGNDAIPLTGYIHLLGWESIIVDGRTNYATRERFPLADKIIVSKPEEVFSKVSPGRQPILVLMTHNYNYDLSIMAQVVSMTPAYVGVLGPKKKLERMIEELRNKRLEVDESCIFGPAGLDIGAETPEEIALSIISEIKAVLAHKNANFLKDKLTAIHSPIHAV